MNFIIKKLLNQKGKRQPFLKAPLNAPGQSTRNDLDDILLAFVMFYLGVPLLVFFFVIGPNILRGQLFYVFIQILSLVSIFLFMFFLHGKRLLRKLRNYRIGYLGEVVIGQELEKTRINGYAVFHDIQVDKPGKKTFNIDHVIIGEAGIIVFETKSKSKNSDGRCEVRIEHGQLNFSDGTYSKDPLEQASRNGKHIQGLIQKLVNDSMKESLKVFTADKTIPVISCVAYPGWFADYKSAYDSEVKLTNEIMVFNFVEHQHKKEKELSQREANDISDLLDEYLRKQKEYLIEV